MNSRQYMYQRPLLIIKVAFLQKNSSILEKTISIIENTTGILEYTSGKYTSGILKHDDKQ